MYTYLQSRFGWFYFIGFFFFYGAFYSSISHLYKSQWHSLLAQFSFFFFLCSLLFSFTQPIVFQAQLKKNRATNRKMVSILRWASVWFYCLQLMNDGAEGFGVNDRFCFVVVVRTYSQNNLAQLMRFKFFSQENFPHRAQFFLYMYESSYWD